MAKRNRGSTQKRIEKWIKEGRGQGLGYEYKPWLKIQDVASDGRVTRLKGITTSRQHEFLSDMETNYFYILEYADNVIDIREQFPLLPIEETQLLAKEIGIKHPSDPSTNEDNVMTTDFLITVKKDNRLIDVARTIKSSTDLMNRRNIEKFEIERKYWEKQGIEWGIVTENEIDETVAENIKYIHSYNYIFDIDSFIDMSESEIEELIIEYTRRVIDSVESIRKISDIFDDDFLLGKGTGISIFRHLVMKKCLKIDMMKPININKHIEIKGIDSNYMESVM
jgi:hypothetical protein